MSYLDILLNCAMHLTLESKVGVVKSENKFSLVSDLPQNHMEDLIKLIVKVFKETKNKNNELEFCAALIAFKKFSGDKFSELVSHNLYVKINNFIKAHNKELKVALAKPKLESLARYKYFTDFSLKPRLISPNFFARITGKSHGNANEIKAIEIVSKSIFNKNTRNVTLKEGPNFFRTINLSYSETMDEFFSGSHLVFIEKPQGLARQIINFFGSLFCIKSEENVQEGVVEQLQKRTNGWFEGNQESSHYKLTKANRLDHFRIKEGGGIISEMLGCKDSLARVDGHLVLGKAFKVAKEEALEANPNAVVEEVKANELQLEDFKDGPANLIFLPKQLKNKGIWDSLIYWLFNTLPHRTVDFIPYQLKRQTGNPKPNVAKYGDGGYSDANAVVLE